MTILDEVMEELHYLIGYTQAISNAEDSSTQETGAFINKKLQHILLALKEVLK